MNKVKFEEAWSPSMWIANLNDGNNGFLLLLRYYGDTTIDYTKNLIVTEQYVLRSSDGKIYASKKYNIIKDHIDIIDNFVKEINHKRLQSDINDIKKVMESGKFDEFT